MKSLYQVFKETNEDSDVELCKPRLVEFIDTIAKPFCRSISSLYNGAVIQVATGSLMFKIPLSDFNLMIGMGWHESNESCIHFQFECNSQDGPTATVTIKDWAVAFPISLPWEGEREVIFRLGDLRDLILAIKPHYKNLHAVLSFKIDNVVWELVGGPGNGMKIEGIA